MSQPLAEHPLIRNDISTVFSTDPNAKGVKCADIRLLIGTPAYGGLTHVPHNQSLRSLEKMLLMMNIRYTIAEMMTESLIPRARNNYANFVAFDKAQDAGDPNAPMQYFTHLLFLDVDIGFNPLNIIQMLGYDKDIIGLPYACKDFNWEKIVKAVSKGITEPNNLSRMGHRAILNTGCEGVQFNMLKPTQFPQIGTGIMLIKRKVLLKFAEDWSRRYKLMAGEPATGGRTHGCDFFRIGPIPTENPEERHYHSEDYRFCLDAIGLGFEVWLLPWAVTTHTGSYTFVLDTPGQVALGMMSDPLPAKTDSGAISGGIIASAALPSSASLPPVEIPSAIPADPARPQSNP